MTPEQPVPSIPPPPTTSWVTRPERPEDAGQIREVLVAAFPTAPFDALDEAFLALALDSSQPVPRGKIAYPPAFGV